MKRVPEAVRAAVVADYEARRLKVYEVAEKHGISLKTLWRIVCAAGCELRNKVGPKEDVRLDYALLARQARRVQRLMWARKAARFHVKHCGGDSG